MDAGVSDVTGQAPAACDWRWCVYVPVQSQVIITEQSHHATKGGIGDDRQTPTLLLTNKCTLADHRGQVSL